ncbi:hypothetical protein [Paenibacillus taichungensis]|uniref:hypothetical protein n=1 Tax=Paenibacillus taichungensis TaxID=484184 RepID=UPI0038CFC6C2
MDNLIELLKEKLEQAKMLIGTTEFLRKQHGKPPEDKNQALSKVQSEISSAFIKWYQEIARIVVEKKLYYNSDLLKFTSPFIVPALNDLGDVGGLVDEMGNYHEYLENAIAEIEHRDTIGMARELKIIENELTDPDYEDITDVLYRYGIQMSRTVDTYYELNEEQIRFTILNALNVVYKGVGSAETFNKRGKTDILICLNGINVFLAECKILKTPKNVTEGLDQLLLKYLTTTDYKAALILFNKKYKPASEALKRAEDKTDAFLKNNGLNFKKFPEEIAQYSDILRYVTDHPLDKAKKLTLTIIVINILK